MSRRLSSSKEEAEEDLFALLPDTWREAASSIYKLYEEVPSPASVSQGKINEAAGRDGFSANHALCEAWDVEVSNATSADEASLNAEEGLHTSGSESVSCDNAVSGNVHIQSTNEEEEERVVPLPTSSIPLDHGRGFIRRLNREGLRWASRVKGIDQDFSRPDKFSVSVGAVEIRESQSPTQCTDTSSKPRGADCLQSDVTLSSLDHLQKLNQITSFELNGKAMESANTLAENVSPRADLPGGSSVVDFDQMKELPVEVEGGESGDFERKLSDQGEAEEEGRAPSCWESSFRLMSGSSRRKTKRRTLVAPRCHDAYDQLATAIQRQAAARSARHHLLCGAVEGLLCVRMPCVTRSSSSDRVTLPQAAFHLDPEGVCCCISATTRKPEVLGPQATPAASSWRQRMHASRGSGSSSHSSTDLLLLYLLLFKELRWGETIQARVRRQVTQLQGCLVSLQRLEAKTYADVNTESSRGCSTVALKDLMELSFDWEERERLDGPLTAEFGAHAAPEDCCDVLHQMKVEDREGENARVAVEPLVAVLRERRSQAVQELRKAQRIIASAQQQVEACRQRHRQHFVEHASHLLNFKNFLNLRLRFEELCAISCAQNELFAFAFFHCLSQEGQPVTWPVVEAMAEPKVFFLAWEALRVGLVAFHLLKTQQDHSEQMHASGTQQLSTNSPSPSSEARKEFGAACAADTSSQPLPSSWLEGMTSHQLLADGAAVAARAAAPVAAEAAVRATTEAATRGGLGQVFLDGLPSHLSLRLLEAVEQSTCLCCAYDAARRESEGKLGREATPANAQQKSLFAVVAAAEEARMHHWTIAGCDGHLKLLVATAVQVAKKTHLFSPHAHASFL
ncbi:hypothetical protein Esti_004308 [Eimeria stiedai]